MGLRTEIAADLEALAPHLAAWDRLVVATARPYCAPAWMLAWWRHAAPARARLRVALAFDGDALVGVAPCYQAPLGPGVAACRMLAGGTSARIVPLGQAGREDEVGPALASALARAQPPSAAFAFEGVESDSLWPARFEAGWGSRPHWRHRRDAIPAPTLAIEGEDFERWISSRSRNFRGQMRRARRRLEEAGARFRIIDREDELDDALGAFARLHHARWVQRGGSQALTPGVERMLGEAGRALLPSGRFRLTLIEIDGRPVSAQLFVAAGGEVAYWLGGFDEEWAHAWPAIQALLVAVEDAMARGERRIDWGPGGQSYKYRLADGEDRLEWLTLVPHGGRYPLARLAIAPVQVRRAIAARLPPETRERLRRAAGRLPRS